jgi:hypothetical protein
MANCRIKAAPARAMALVCAAGPVLGAVMAVMPLVPRASMSAPRIRKCSVPDPGTAAHGREL